MFNSQEYCYTVHCKLHLVDINVIGHSDDNAEY